MVRRHSNSFAMNVSRSRRLPPSRNPRPGTPCREGIIAATSSLTPCSSHAQARGLADCKWAVNGKTDQSAFIPAPAEEPRHPSG